MYEVCDVQVCIESGKLSYVVSMPLIDKGQFKAYYLVPIPIPVNTHKLVHIGTAKSILCVDTTRQYYLFGSDQELQGCKEVTNEGACVSKTNRYCPAYREKNAQCDCSREGRPFLTAAKCITCS